MKILQGLSFIFFETVAILNCGLSWWFCIFFDTSGLFQQAKRNILRSALTFHLPSEAQMLGGFAFFVEFDRHTLQR